MTGSTGSTDPGFRVGPDADPDRYVLGPAVASGTEGILYRGSITTATGVELPVAVKMLQPRLLARVDEWHARWSEQVELLRSLQIPGVVRVRDGFLGPMPHGAGGAGTAGGRTLYLIMNWEEGEPLDEWVRRQPDRDPFETLKLLLPVAAALDLMHSGASTGGVPVVHRDVKPSNIIVVDDGTVLVDFGLTRGLAAGSRTSAVSGTPGYLAPEVTSGGEYTSATDRYAFASVAYFVFTGVEAPPTHQPGLMRAALAAVPALSDRAETVDHVMQMLADDPAARPDGLANWVGQLRRSSIDGLPGVLAPQAPGRHPQVPSPPPPEPKPEPEPVRPEPPPARPAGPEFDPPDAAAPADPVPVPALTESERRRSRRRLLLLPLLALALVGVAVTLWPPPTPVIPDQVGALQPDARYELAVRGYPSVVELAFDDDIESGHVTAQVPVGVRKKKGTTVTLTVSKGPGPVAVPDLSGRTRQEAASVLMAAHLKVGTVTPQNDDRAAADKVLSWSPKDTQTPKGTAIDLIVSSGPVPPGVTPAPSALTKGGLAPKSYVTTRFRPSMTFSVKDGWEATLESADHVTLKKTGDPQGRRIDVMRIQRVYGRGAFSTEEEALNSVTAYEDSLAPWLTGHSAIKVGASAQAPKVAGVKELTQQLDVTFTPYAYEGCPDQSPKCVILFQLDPFPPEKPKTYAYVAADGEATRFQIYDVGSAKIVVATTAKADVRSFAAEVAAGSFTIDRFGDDTKITRTRLELSPKAGNESVVTATVNVEGCSPGDGTVSIFSQAVAPENRLSERLPLTGRTVVRDIRLIGPGPHRVIVQYDGDQRCDMSVSAPAITAR